MVNILQLGGQYGVFYENKADENKLARHVPEYGELKDIEIHEKSNEDSNTRKTYDKDKLIEKIKEEVAKKEEALYVIIFSQEVLIHTS